MADHEAKIQRARARVEEERAAHAAWLDKLDARDQAVNEALESAPEGMSDNEVARRIGLNASTFRSITLELRKVRARAKK